MDISLYHDLLAKHQHEALGQLSNGKILKGGVGTGKTRVAVAYYKKNEAPKDVYVITTSRKRDEFDWPEEFYRFDVGPKEGPNPASKLKRGVAKAGATVSQTVSSRGRGGASEKGLSENSSIACEGASGKRFGIQDADVRGSRGIYSSDDRSSVEVVGGGISGQGSGSSPGVLHLRNRDDESRRGEASLHSDVRLESGSGGDAGVCQEGHARDTDSQRETEVSGRDYSRGTRMGTAPEASEQRLQWALTVDSWNNINKYVGVKGAFFIFDEQRLVGSGAWTKAFLKIARNNNWILLSATPGDTWLDYVPVFLANGFYPNRTAFKHEHVVYSTYTQFPKVERYRNVGKLVRLRRQLLVEMPYLRHTERRIEEVQVDYDKESLDLVLKKRWDIYNDEPIVDAAGLFRVARKLINTHSTRLDACYRLMQKHDRLIIFYSYDYELEILRQLKDPYGDEEWQLSSDKSESLNLREEGGLSFEPNKPESSTKTSDFVIAEWNGHKHEPVPTTKRWVYLVQYTAGHDAWNCIETNAMIFYSLQYSWKVFEQAQGRIDRLNTPFKVLYYYYLASRTGVDRTIWTSLKNKEDFNERKYEHALVS